MLAERLRPTGVDHPHWAGADITYFGMHERIWRARGKADRCINGCDHTRYEWAHIHDTDRLDVMNYQPMCIRCHRRYDSGGENHYNAKLTWEKVEEIRALHYFGVKQARLTKIYGRSSGNISDIVNVKTWIPEPVCTESRGN